MLAPALHIDPKSRFGPLDEDRFLCNVVRAARGTEVPLPVVFGRRHLGWVVGERNSPYVWYRGPMKAAGFTTLADIKTAVAAGQQWKQVFYKLTNGPQAGIWGDFWGEAGDPVSGDYTGTAKTARQFNNTNVGGIQHGPSVSPMQKHLAYFTMAQIVSTGPSQVAILYDRVLSYDACPFPGTSAVSMTNTLAAQRWISAGQPGLQLMWTAQTIFANTTLTLTDVKYTDQSGNTGQTAYITSPNNTFFTVGTASAVGSTPAMAALIYPDSGGTISPFMTLSVGDTGMQKLESYTTTESNTGTASLVLCRPLAYIMMPAAGRQCELDTINQLLNPERIYDDACLSFIAWFSTNSNATTYQGRIETVYG